MQATIDSQATRMVATATARSSATPTATQTPTPSPTSSIVEVTPCGDPICEVEPLKMAAPASAPTRYSQEEIDGLARLCVVEFRGFAEKRADACVSAVSTILKRMETGEYSDGTVEGTITWGCGPDTIACQFPAYAWNGCMGIQARTCPWNYPSDIIYFRDAVWSFLEGRFPPASPCLGYTYYDSSTISSTDCIIRSSTGQVEGWHN